MIFLRAIGKECKSRVMHLTESEAGGVFVAAVALNIGLILIWLIR